MKIMIEDIKELGLETADQKRGLKMTVKISKQDFEIRNVESLLRLGENRPELLLFYGHRVTKAVCETCLSQWYPCKFEVEGVTYTSAEQYMMAEKAKLFGDEEIRAEILSTSDQRRGKALGRKVKGFDPEVWEENKFRIVTEGNKAKFAQNDSLKKFLLSTGDKVLVEASPTDRIWGIGLDKHSPDAADPTKWRGKNLLGFALMQVREALSIEDLSLNHLKDYAKNLKAGNLYTIAGRPTMGKTTIARHIANMLSENGQKVLYIDTEGMSEEEKAKRRNDKFDYLYQRLISVEEVRDITFIGKYNIVVIDNFQYMSHRKMPHTSYRLKRLAEELHVVVIALSHISRRIDMRKNHNPWRLDMPRNMCGSLWESSDHVMFLRRRAYYEPDSKNDIMDVFITKDIEHNSKNFQMDFMKLKEIWTDKA